MLSTSENDFDYRRQCVADARSEFLLEKKFRERERERRFDFKSREYWKQTIQLRICDENKSSPGWTDRNDFPLPSLFLFFSISRINKTRTSNEE